MNKRFSLQKKSIIVLFFLLILGGISSQSMAQFSMGIKVAYNFSNYINQSSLNPGFDAGLFFRFGNNFYFQPEANYSFRSTTFSEAIDEFQDNLVLKTHNIDVPLLFGYKIVNKNNFNFRLFAGPRLGFRIAGEDDWDEIMGVTQWGAQVGLGIDLWRFTLDFKYDFSANKSKNNTNKSYWTQNMYNLALGFKLFK